MPLQRPGYLARKLGAKPQANIAGSFPTTAERQDRADFDEVYRDFRVGLWLLPIAGAIWIFPSAIYAAADYLARWL